ncbi:MAG: DMT family transporter [Methanosarcina thermophila]|jgi:drug/metabolite transporter (DMT)-like permease|uniref:Integral membrane protein n=4 Tax=Methanosarcina thermophila TaxID=2210 RepID=A0A0E3NB57_METTE|nr:DMT family transporter [Methanosarcina thermophila]ALK06117.1 MAG: ABC transporter permease [Methanosarcina sp. 795]AKB12276.1 integral membrane protein [Methanosarcina thermophila TM-1]AKB14520.1 integral membrane protein [Methanosarcina thermophila CHTI-55]NLU56463.1 DMT family transporter [Methanosarcina thermophila]SFT67556.1 Permease of the drug/metabolite transporter (DMT) superfamily [Methanosarcina thermophila]
MPVQESSLKPHFEVITGSIIYGTIGVFLNMTEDMSAGSLLFSRLFFGFFIILFYLLLNREIEQLRPKKRRKYLLLLGFSNAVTGICYFSSIQYSGVSVAVLLFYTAPIYVNILAPPILGESRSSNSFLSLLLAITGVLLIARPSEILIDTGSDFQKGFIFGLLSGLSFSVTIITIRYLRNDYTGIAQTFWLTGISLLFTLPAALATPLAVFVKNLDVLFFFGLTITLAAVIYLKGISGVKAQTGSILALMEPVSGIFFDVTILKTPLYISTFLGCALILAAAYIVSKKDG